MRADRRLILGALASAGLTLYACGSNNQSPGGTPDGGGGGDSPANPDSPQGGDAPLSGTFTAGSVLEHHLHPSRDGLYTDPLITKSAAAMVTRDMGFAGTIAGNVLGQPLYGSDVTPGKDAVFVATEGNNVYSLDAKTGAQNWMKNLGASEPLASLPCGGGIDP